MHVNLLYSLYKVIPQDVKPSSLDLKTGEFSRSTERLSELIVVA